MKNPILVAPLALTVMFSDPALSDTRASIPQSQALPATICEISHAILHAKRPRMVSITAWANYDFEHGYFLEDPRCMKGKGLSTLAGLLKIDFPPEKTDWDDPELKKLASQDWLQKEAMGKYVYCTCVGKITYSEGSPKFVLDHAERVWASENNMFVEDYRPKI